VKPQIHSGKPAHLAGCEKEKKILTNNVAETGAPVVI
jgi:hypothetical protein